MRRDTLACVGPGRSRTVSTIPALEAIGGSMSTIVGQGGEGRGGATDPAPGMSNGGSGGSDGTEGPATWTGVMDEATGKTGLKSLISWLDQLNVNKTSVRHLSQSPHCRPSPNHFKATKTTPLTL